MIAITHEPSPAIVNCALTYVAREPINFQRALVQHAEYERVLRESGATVHRLRTNMHLPDCVFVEDTAVVFDEVAVIASMGALSRRDEPGGIAAELSNHRELVHIELPALLDGGDVVVAGKSVLVGLSSRTDAAGVEAMRAALSRFGYSVRAVRVSGCLHLKSACTSLPDGRLLVNREWLREEDLAGFGIVDIVPQEPFSADVALVGENIIAGAAFPRTNQLLGNVGFRVREVDLSEFHKAEGGVTCLSLVFRNNRRNNQAEA